MERNRHGLSRHIPSSIKRNIRKRCAFGCVLCGKAIIQYEHIIPLYKDATKHDEEKMTLLCPGHHAESTNGLLSKQTIETANKNPFCKKDQPPKHMLDVRSGDRPKIILAGNDMSECGGRIVVAGQTLFSIRPPQRGSTVWQLNATLKHEGAVVCRIIDNEIEFDPCSADIVQTANRFAVSTKGNKCILALTSLPPDGISLDLFELPMGKGVCILGQIDFPDLGGPGRSQKVPAITFVHNNGDRQVFANGGFHSRTGIYLDMIDGSLRFAGSPP